MWKKIAIGGAVAAAIVGAGTASVALTGSDTPSPSTTSTSAAAPGEQGRGPLARHGKHPLARLGKHVLHGQWVVKNKDGDVVTRDEIHGSVTAVSATSITVKAEDGVSQTYAITSDTKVRQRTQGKPRSGDDSDISKVKTGDNVVVLGTGTDTLTADAVIDIQE